MVLGLATQLFGGRRLRGFDERCRWIGAIGGGVGSALLIYDLGRKSRFLNMLRVFRPTSPMSVGSWVLAAATPGSWVVLDGYELPAKAAVKAGGAVKAIDCGDGKTTVCSVKLEGWVTMKDGWQVLKQDYSGEGILPNMFGQRSRKRKWQRFVSGIATPVSGLRTCGTSVSRRSW